MKKRWYVNILLGGIVASLVLSFAPLSYANTNNNNNNGSTIVINQKDEKKDPLDTLKSYAEAKGSEYGKMFAGRDYMQGLKDDPKRHFSTATSVYSYFKMSSDNSEHKRVFYQSFIEAYRFSYEEAYIDISMNDRDDNEAFWYQAARTYGAIEGRIAAYYDHLNEYRRDWEFAFKRFINDEGLTERFRLNRFTGQLPKNFELDFKLEFKRSYEEAYATAIVEDNKKNTNYFYVDAEGNTLTYSRDYAEVSQGGQGNKPMPVVEAVFPERCVLERTPMAIRYKQHINKVKQPYLIPLSDIYELELQRGHNSVVFNEEPTFSVKGYAVRGAGIYKWNNNRWEYVFTTIAEKELITKLRKGRYSNTEFAVFMDETYVSPSDIYFNWAFKEIYTAVRRHNVPQTEKFLPENKITRLDLANFVYRSLSHRFPASSGGVRNITDSAQIAYASEAVNYCLAKGYLTLDAAGRFNPKAVVEYIDFQTMMKRIAPSYNLTDHLASQLEEKFYRSDYLTKKSRYISRSEVVYALLKYMD